MRVGRYFKNDGTHDQIPLAMLVVKESTISEMGPNRYVIRKQKGMKY